MRRGELEHVLRAACEIAGAAEALVIGSQAILGSFSEDALPPEAFRSIEVDLAFLDDVNDERSDRVDGAIGELSPFHETYGYYAQGVSVSTAILPSGWQDRLIMFDTPRTAPGRGLCLEPHDLVVSKLVAFRRKDQEFAAALVRAGVVDADVLRARIALLDVGSAIQDRLRDWLRDGANR
jgi:uncharacterized nucleotidyltransferase DUF6036